MTHTNGTIASTPMPGDPANMPSPSMSPEKWVTSLAEVTAAFSRWLEDRSDDERIWPAFDRFIRETLLDLVGATRVRLFRTADGGRGLRPLAEESGAASDLLVPTGLTDHVLATGRRYIRGDWTHGALVDQLAAESDGAWNRAPASALHAPDPATPDARPADASAVPACDTTDSRPPANEPSHGCTAPGPVAWMFGIRSRGSAASRGDGVAANHAVGLVVVGEILERNLAARDGLEALANLINGFWIHVRDFESLQLARRTDRGSGVLNRMDFLDAADAAATEAEHEGEPVVVMAVAMEGLRRLDDDGHWTVRDRLIQEAGRVLRRKLRNDDIVGRFSDDRFVVLLRWLDLALGRLIAAKVVQSLRESVANVLHDAFPTGGKDYIKVRCGLASSRGPDSQHPGASAPDAARATPWDACPSPAPPTLNDLLVGALSASATARRNGQEICIAGSDGAPPGGCRTPAREFAGVEMPT